MTLLEHKIHCTFFSANFVVSQHHVSSSRQIIMNAQYNQRIRCPKVLLYTLGNEHEYPLFDSYKTSGLFQNRHNAMIGRGIAKIISTFSNKVPVYSNGKHTSLNLPIVIYSVPGPSEFNRRELRSPLRTRSNEDKSPISTDGNFVESSKKKHRNKLIAKISKRSASRGDRGMRSEKNET